MASPLGEMAMAMALPELFGPYLLHHRLAQGLTSEVFLAQTTGEYPRVCAVKRILPELAALPDFTPRFRRDAALLVQLIHGNLVQVLEVGAVEDWPFVAMEHLDGVHLAELISEVPERGPLPTELALYVGLEVCEAVTYVQLRRREESGAPFEGPEAAWPLEVLLTFDGVVKVIDLGSFGALRLGEYPPSRLFRSPGYSVPEVILRRPLDLRSDLFAVGLMVWELLAGRRLVVHDPEGYVRQVLAGTWRAPLITRKDVPGSVIRLVQSLLSLEPDARPAGMAEVRRPLVEALRRLAPAYGSATLAQFLFRRFPSLVGRSEELTRELVRRVRTDPQPSIPGRTLTFGHTRNVQRRVSAPAPLQTGDPIPGTRYRLVRWIGEGGSAQVCAAQHIDLDRQVAIKILSPQLAEDAEAIAQFRMEARACSRVGHPNIIEVIDFGELEDGRFFFAMELLEGESLADVLARETTLDPGRAVGILRQVCKALHAAHQQGIVHRDLKPDNVMLVEKDGRPDFVKVLDFGVMAFASDATGRRVGTLGYMAPEQVEGTRPTPAMDIYGAGTLLYEILAGELPYPADTFEAFAELQRKNPPPALRSRPRASAVPAPLERVVQRALERDPGARHPSMADFEADLILAQGAAGLVTAWDDLAPPGAVKDRRPEERRPPARRRRWAWVAVAAVAPALALAAGNLALRDRARASREPAPLVAPAARREASQPAPELVALLRRAEEAVGSGQFTQPAGDNALDLLRRAEAEHPGSEETRTMRQRIARTLEGAGDRLLAGGLPQAGRTLYQEARLFDPASQRLAEIARAEPAPDKAAAPRRPEAGVTQIAWLLSQVQLAVADGRYLRPPEASALRFLNRLRQLDPSGQKTTEAQQVMTSTLRRRADELWRRGELGSAASIYQLVLVLDPQDATARARGRQGRDAGASPSVASAGSEPPAPAPKPAADPALGKQLVAEGLRLLDQGRMDEARRKLRSAMKANARDGAAVAGLAALAFEEAKYARAVELADQALALNRRLVSAHLIRGDANFKLLRYDDARRAWEEVLRLDPGNPRAKRRMQTAKQSRE